MRARNKTLEVFSMSALDLFASALGAFILVAVILFPYYKNLSKHKLPHADVVIVLDTTGSMRDVTESLKREIQDFSDIARKLAPSLAVGLVAFNDIQGVPPAEEIFALSEIRTDNGSMEELQQYIKVVQAGAADWAGRNERDGENLLGGMQLAVAANWRETTKPHLRVIVVVTDDIPHPGTGNDILEIARDASCDHCLLIAIRAITEYSNASETESFLRELAEAGKGVYYETNSSMLAPILRGMLDHVN